ncbi:MAG TPA: hypothetical protein VGQ39_25010, partial [Pyrinomonadaceae bacterium]|nr:hypothetical protein [Pyrinomonadaceae bacterium]
SKFLSEVELISVIRATDIFHLLPAYSVITLKQLTQYKFSVLCHKTHNSLLQRIGGKLNEQ